MGELEREIRILIESKLKNMELDVTKMYDILVELMGEKKIDLFYSRPAFLSQKHNQFYKQTIFK